MRAGRHVYIAVLLHLFIVPNAAASHLCQSSHAGGDTDRVGRRSACSWDAHWLVVNTRSRGSNRGWRGARRWGWLAERIAFSFWFGEPIDVLGSVKMTISPAWKSVSDLSSKPSVLSARCSSLDRPDTLPNGFFCKPVGDLSGRAFF